MQGPAPTRSGAWSPYVNHPPARDPYNHFLFRKTQVMPPPKPIMSAQRAG